MAESTTKEQPLADGEFGYSPTAARGVIERRRRPKLQGIWSEIEKTETGYVVRSQFGTEAPDVFAAFGKALEAAKTLDWCEESVAELARRTEEKEAKAQANGEEPSDEESGEQPKRRRQRRSGKANGPRTSDRQDHPVESRVDESIKKVAA